MNYLKHKSQANGFTLVELLIGLFISLLVGGVAITFLVSSSRTISSQNAEDVIQENVRYAFEIISSTARLAGSNASLNAQTFEDEKQPLFNGAICAGNANCNTNNQTFNIGGSSTGTTETDTVAFAYIANSGTTCTGFNITSEQQVVTQFFVGDVDGDGVASLYCNAFVASQNYITQDFDGHFAPNPAVALIDGVEALQIQYGLDLSVPKDETVDSYVTYGNAAGNYENIRSVKIGFLFSNAQESDFLGNTELQTQQPVATTYRVMDGTATITGRVLRKVATTTVFLPNS